jgi:hypothetical protein
MRLALSIIALLASATTVAAEPWTDPTSVVSLEPPAGWIATGHPTDGLTYVVASSAASECHIVGVPRPQTAERTPYSVRFAAETPIGEANWAHVVGAFPDLFPGAMTLQSARVDTEQFWRVQRADYAVAGGPSVHAAIQFRPGLELWALCRTRSGAEESVAFDAIFNSVGTPQDAALQATAILQQEAAEEHGRGSRVANAAPRPPEQPYLGPDSGLTNRSTPGVN